MKVAPPPNGEEELTETWTLPSDATLGSSVRKKGIFLEVRARLPTAAKKSLHLAADGLTLRMPIDSGDGFQTTSAVISKALEGIESLPVIPREIEDILAISTTERHRWLKDGRLPSAGTRSVKLRGRARKVTFHVFDPLIVEDVLDRDLVANWREEDAAKARDNRRRAAWKARLIRSPKSAGEAELESESTPDEDSHPKLLGWDEFERDGPLR